MAAEQQPSARHTTIIQGVGQQGVHVLIGELEHKQVKHKQPTSGPPPSSCLRQSHRDSALERRIRGNAPQANNRDGLSMSRSSRPGTKASTLCWGLRGAQGRDTAQPSELFTLQTHPKDSSKDQVLPTLVAPLQCNIQGTYIPHIYCMHTPARLQQASCYTVIGKPKVTKTQTSEKLSQIQ